ncbi:MAG: T9SS type A sorting domain-containing protein [Bacteroidales bacterium]
MKKTILILSIFLSASSGLQAQINLVPNPSLERYDTCPDLLTQLYKANDWNININTVDYFNSCSSNSDVSVPKNIMGFQMPDVADCNAYAGFNAYIQFTPGSVEFLGTQLLTPLTVGQKYFVSFKVSLAYDAFSINCGIDKIGALFTNIFYGDTIIIPPPVINNFAHIYSNQIITDTTNWTVITGSFVADSAYQYILIGNFFDTSNVNTLCFNSNSKWSYYYVDDICVSNDSLTCNPYNHSCSISVSEEYYENIFNIYPNPVKEKIFITANFQQAYQYSLYNSIGNKLLFDEHSLNDTDVDISKLPNGIYFLLIQTNHQIINKKVLLIK